MIEITIKLNSDPMSGVEWFKTLIPLIAAIIGSVGAFVGAGIAAVLAIRAYRTNQWWDTRNKVYQETVTTLHECLVASHALFELIKNYQEKGRAALESGFDKVFDNFSELLTKIEALESKGRFNMSPEARQVLASLYESTSRTIASGESDEVVNKEISKLLECCLEQFSDAAKRDLNVLPWTHYFKPLKTSVKRAAEFFKNSTRKAINAILLATLIIWLGQRRGTARFDRMKRA